VLGIEGLAPYWFEVGAALFVSDRGDLSARLEADYDLRLTQRLILEPRLELNLSASDVPELGLGSGLTDAELGLRLRYAVTPDLSPYVGVVHEETFGRTADFAAAHGEETRDTRLVVGLRAWF
jgi:copper resistance protein B